MLSELAICLNNCAAFLIGKDVSPGKTGRDGNKKEEYECTRGANETERHGNAGVVTGTKDDGFGRG